MTQTVKSTNSTDMNGKTSFTVNTGNTKKNIKYSAKFEGDNNHIFSTSNEINIEVINQNTNITPVITLTSNKSNVVTGDIVNLKATITDSSNNPISGINVNFYNIIDMNNPVGNATTTSSGEASVNLTVTATSAGSWNYVAVTVPSTGYNSVTSQNVPISANTTETVLTLYSNATSVNYGGSITFTVTLQDSNGNVLPNQSVILYQGSGQITTLTTDVTGQKSYTVSNITSSASYSAVFTGKNLYGASNSDSITINVGSNTTALSITSNGTNFDIHGSESLIISGSLTSNGNGISGAQVVLYQAGNTRDVTQTSINGDYSFTVPITATTNGSWSFKVKYSGESGYSGSESGTVNVSAYDSYATSFSNVPSSLASGDVINPKLLDYLGNPVAGESVSLKLTRKSTSESQTWSGTTDTNGELYGLNGAWAGLKVSFTFTDTLILNLTYSGKSNKYNSCGVNKEIPYSGG